MLDATNSIETIYQPEYEKRKEISSSEATEYLYGETFIRGLNPRNTEQIHKFFDDFRKYN